MHPMTIRTVQFASLCFLVGGLSTAVSSDDPPKNDAFVHEIVKLHTGFAYTEGPAADAHGNVYFSDIPNNRIHKIDAEGRLSTFLENSEACNGLMIDAQGRLLACQGKAKRLIAIDTQTKKITILADKCEGKELGTPNDLVIDRAGGVYFTATDTEFVFYVDAQGMVTRLPVKTSRPNGVKLSLDETTLYVLPSGTGKVMAYPVVARGKLGMGKVFCELVPNPKNPGRPGGDGLVIDDKGNVYLTRPSMKLIQVVDAEGKTLRLIHLPQEPSNCTFGGVDNATLYVTAQSSIYALKTDATGRR
jgi:gluconolactonase